MNGIASWSIDVMINHFGGIYCGSVLRLSRKLEALVLDPSKTTVIPATQGK